MKNTDNINSGENRQKTGRKQLSYRQVIFSCLAGLMGMLLLGFFLYVYCEFRAERKEMALREAQKTAEDVAVWTDAFFASADPEDMEERLSAWEQGVRACAGRGEEIVILDGQGRAVFSTDSTLNEVCGNAWGEASESPILSAGGGIFLAVGFSAPETREWSCFVFHDVAEKMDGYPFPFGRFVIVLLLTGIGFMTTAYLIYRPVDRLLKSVGEETGQKIPPKNELEYLGDSFRALEDDSRKLREKIGRKQDRLQEVFALSLIRGDAPLREESGEYEKYVENLGLHSWQYFATVAAMLHLGEDEEAQSDVEEDVVCRRLVEEMPAGLKKLAWLPPVCNAGVIVAILGGDDEDMLRERIEEYYTGLRKFSETACSYQLLMGVSASHADIRHISAAYQESVDALTRSEARGQADGMEDCRFYLAGGAFSKTPYDAVYEKNIQSGIKDIDKEQCYKAVDGFFRYLAEKNCSQDEIMVYILRFVNTILLTAMDIRVELPELYPDGFRRLYDELLELPELSRERRYIKWKLIDPILGSRSRLMEKRSYSMLEDIEQLIRERRGDLSMAECAEILAVHPTYIWKVLKTEKGKTFSDCLEEYKLEEAKRLLLDTDMTVAEIASALNYNNAQNFIRFFSKSTGVTPGKFRKSP